VTQSTAVAASMLPRCHDSDSITVLALTCRRVRTSTIMKQATVPSICASRLCVCLVQRRSHKEAQDPGFPSLSSNRMRIDIGRKIDTSLEHDSRRSGHLSKVPLPNPALIKRLSPLVLVPNGILCFFAESLIALPVASETRRCGLESRLLRSLQGCGCALPDS
jgi:hypothetical protein